jgi:signal peptidase
MRIFSYLKISSEVLLGSLVFVVLPMAVFTILTAKTNLLGIKSFTVVTGSMSPLIPVGSIEYVIPSGSYGLGDIISFERDKKNITHRIVGIVPRDGQLYYETKGDANNSVDSDLVPENKITGEILFHFPYVGFWTAYIRTVQGFLTFIAFPTLVFVGFELWNIKKEVEKETEKKVLKKVLKTIQTYG